MFIGKVSDIIGWDKTMGLLKESKYAFKDMPLSLPKEVEPKKEVDLDELRDEYMKDFANDGLIAAKFYETYIDTTFNWFAKRIQKPVESDAVEFAQFLFDNKYRKCMHTFPSKVGMYFSDITENGYITIEELYEQFKQLKK